MVDYIPERNNNKLNDLNKYNPKVYWTLNIEMINYYWNVMNMALF